MCGAGRHQASDQWFQTQIHEPRADAQDWEGTEEADQRPDAPGGDP
jgi:hypothetical protein